MTAFKTHGDELIELRKNPQALRKLETMEWSLSIPEDEFEILKAIMPDLVCEDAETRTRAWKNYIASDASMAYRVREHKGRYFNGQA